MAISSKKFTASNKKRDFYLCQEADAEIRDYLEGCYESNESDFGLTPKNMPDWVREEIVKIEIKQNCLVVL